MHPVKCGKFLDGGLHGKSGTGPALVVPGVAMAVGNSNGNTGHSS
jgi:hypothetical protein